MKFLITILLSLPFCAKAQTLIKGTITHAFNANAEGKPDAGSKVYLLKYEGEVITIFESINSFLIAKNMRNLSSDVNRLVSIYKDSASAVKGQKKFEAKYIGYQNMIVKIKSDEVERVATLQAMGAETNVKYDLLDQRSVKAISQAKLRALDLRLLADATGDFTINNIAPGPYMLLYISSNRVGFTNTEGSGKIFVQKIDVKEGETIKVDNKFIPD